MCLSLSNHLIEVSESRKVYPKMRLNLERGCGSLSSKIAILFFSISPPRDFPEGNTATPVSLMQDYDNFFCQCRGLYKTYLVLEEKIREKIKLFKDKQ